MKEELLSRMQKYCDKMPTRLYVIEQIKDRLLEIAYRQYEIGLEYANEAPKDRRKELKKEEQDLYDELIWRMQDYEDLTCLEILPPIDDTENGLNYIYKDVKENESKS